jgi:putative acetyltransferase
MVRPEQPADAVGISTLLQQAFAGPLEAKLVEELRRSGDLTLSFVAERDGRIVGHIAFSPVSAGGRRSGLGLAPLAVLPEHQRSGVGRELMTIGMQAAGQRECGFVVVLGPPTYYERFGFQPARLFGLTDEFGGGDAFQVAELIPGAVPRQAGLVRYAPAFALFNDPHANSPQEV